MSCKLNTLTYRNETDAEFHAPKYTKKYTKDNLLEPSGPVNRTPDLKTVCL